MSNLVLIGMMGSAKTSVGRAISSRLKLSFVDTDDIFVSRFGNIADFFEKFSEADFRLKESQIVEEVSRLDGVIIACGGGVPLRAENISNLKNNGFVTLLTASAEVILDRVSKSDDRPLLKGDIKGKIDKIMSERSAIYSAAADAVVDNSLMTVDECADKVIELYLNSIK